MRAEDQERILTELCSRVVARAADRHGAGASRLDEVLADGVYHERRRLKDESDSARKREDAAFWSEVRRSMRGASERAQQDLVRRVTRRYAEEISGNFDERVYNAVTRFGAPSLGLLLNAISPKRLVTQLPRLPTLDDAIVLQGHTEHLRRLHELGTVILVPTHVSNMDSIVVGYSLWRLGLPPFIYGAGLNLFSNPLIGFFMHNLGAYTVDRKKKDPLYKEVLKEYATLTLEHGYDNIFFPGGTRSRSGALERHLKLGLLGTGVTAFVNNLQRGKADPRVYVVPATLSFNLVLEAETLIDDFMKEVGKSRYIITDDEFSEPKRVFDFLRQIFSLDSKIYFTIGRGLDPFGNPVDDDGNSLDPQGRLIDPARYVMRGGEPVVHAQRDAEYTRELGEQVSAAFERDSVVLSTHVTARAVFNLLRRQNADIDMVRLLRAGGHHEDMELRVVHDEADRLLTELRGLQARGGVRLGNELLNGTPEDVVADGLKHFAIYHQTAAAMRRGDRVIANDRQLLFYYQNRLEGYRLERDQPYAPALSDDRRTLRVAA
jgi:glycerol-3-phosphate O-acyltransferase